MLARHLRDRKKKESQRNEKKNEQISVQTIKILQISFWAFENGQSPWPLIIIGRHNHHRQIVYYFYVSVHTFCSVCVCVSFACSFRFGSAWYAEPIAPKIFFTIFLFASFFSVSLFASIHFFVINKYTKTLTINISTEQKPLFFLLRGNTANHSIGRDARFRKQQKKINVAFLPEKKAVKPTKQPLIATVRFRTIDMSNIILLAMRTVSNNMTQNFSGKWFA